MARQGAGQGGAGGSGNPAAGVTAAAQAAAQATAQAQSGLGKLKAGWADFAGDLLEPIAVLAAGGTKVQAAWAGMKGVFITRVLGPLGMVVGAATGFLLLSRKLVAEWKTFGIQGAKAIETLTLQFKPLLGSLDLAKKRAREVFAFSVKTPYKFGDLAEGNKILEALTRGALSTAEGMTLVGDAAAVAGTDFADTARQVGRLYDGLMSGRPVGEAAFRLQELGLISGQTRSQIEAMQAANAAGSAVWEVARKDLEATKGAMEALSQSLEGLESTFEDTRTQLEAGFGQGFMEGEKAAIKSATLVMERMVPTASYLGEQIGTVSNFFAELKAKTVDAVTGFPGFSKVVTGAVMALAGLAAAVVAATGALVGRFLLGVISAAYGNRLLAASARQSALAAATQAVAINTLTGAQARLALGTQALAAKQYMAAAAHLRAAAAEAIAALKTNGLAASQVILRGALGLTGKALVFVTRQLVGMAVAIMATPAFWIAAALTAAAAAALHFYTEAKKAREELEEMANAARATVSNLRQQALAIRTVADLRKAEADVVMKLAEAYKDLYLAQQSGEAERVAIAQKKVADLLKVQGEIRSKSGKVELTEEEVGREDERKNRAEQARRARDDDEAGRGDASAVLVARRVKEEGDRLRALEEAAEAEEKRLAAAQEQSRQAVEDRSMKKGALQGEKRDLIEGISERRDAEPASVAGRERAVMTGRLQMVQDELEGIEKLEAAEEARISKMALGSASELARLNEKMRIYATLKSAETAYEAARLAANTTSEKSHAQQLADIEAQGKALRALQQARDVAAMTGVAGMSDLDKQNAERRVQEIKAKREENLDPVKRDEEARVLRDAELALAQGRVEAEAKIADLRLKGYEAEAKGLRAEEEKLELARQAKAVDEDGYAKQKALLDERKAALERETALKREELEKALQIANLRRREEAAREGGQQGQAERLRREAEAMEEARTRRDVEREAEALPENERGGYIERRMEEERAAREQERARQEEEKRTGRDQTVADQNSASAEIEARAKELRGQGEQAKAIREAAAREQDEMARREKAQEYRRRGFGAEQADEMANADVKNAQVKRMMEDLMGGGGANTVVASSLAEVGGGGNVYGGAQEKSLQLLERIAKAIEDANDPNKMDIGW